MVEVNEPDMRRGIQGGLIRQPETTASAVINRPEGDLKQRLQFHGERHITRNFNFTEHQSRHRIEVTRHEFTQIFGTDANRNIRFAIIVRYGTIAINDDVSLIGLKFDYVTRTAFLGGELLDFSVYFFESHRIAGC